MNINRNNKMYSVLILLFFSFLFSFLNHQNSNQDMLKLEFTSDDFMISDNIDVNKGIVVASGENTRIQGPSMNLEEGNYSLNIDYDFSGLETVGMLWSNKATTNGFEAGEIFAYFQINELENSLSVDFTLDKYVSDLTLYIDMSYGTISLENISVTSQGIFYNTTSIQDMLILIITALLLLFLVQNKVQRWVWTHKREIVIAFLVLFITSLPLFASSLHGSEYQDLSYHLSRIEGLSDALKLGHFPARIHPTELNSYGQAVGIFYPELFLYYPAILRLFGMSLTSAYKNLVFMVNIFTIIISYISLKHIFNSRNAGVLGMIILPLATYRLTTLFVRSAVGEYLAIIFIPLVLWGLIEVFYRNSNKWYILTFAMTGILQSHLITTELVAICCIIFALINYRKLVDKKIILSLFKAIIFFILINLWWLLPFLTSAVQGVGAFSRNYGIEEPIVREVWKLFSIDYPLREGVNMPFSIGFLLLIGVLIFIYQLMKQPNKLKEFNYKLGVGFLVFGIITLWMSTGYFPWKFLCEMELIKSFASSLQFSWRLLTISSFLLSIVTIIALINIKFSKKILFSSIIFFLFSMMGAKILLGNILLVPVAAPASYQAELDDPGYTLGGWYLPKGTNEFTIYYRPMVVESDKDNFVLNNYIRNGDEINFDFSSQDSVTLTFPLVYYEGYYVTIDDKEVDYIKTKDNLVAVNIDGPLDGSIQIFYKEMFIFKLANLVSLISLVGVLWICYKMRNAK
ncbi:MAG: hypothetical protein RR945_01615 [Erysipelotrichaceae bacterium]